MANPPPRGLLFQAFSNLNDGLGDNIKSVAAAVKEIEASLAPGESLATGLTLIANNTAQIESAASSGLAEISGKLDSLEKALTCGIEGLSNLARQAERIADYLTGQGPYATDRCTALYAEAFDSHGKVIARTPAGRMLHHIGITSLMHLVEGDGLDGPRETLEGFIIRIREQLKQNQPGGVIGFMTDEDLKIFYRRAPAVKKALEESQPIPR